MNLAQTFLSFGHAGEVILLQGIVLLEVSLHLGAPELWEGKAGWVRSWGIAT
jgi:hypothetical protein